MAELARLAPAETIASETSAYAEAATTLRPRSEFDSAAGEARLKALFGVATLDGFGQFSRAGLAAAGGLVAYLDPHSEGRPPLPPPAAPAPGSAADGDRRRRPARAWN